MKMVKVDEDEGSDDSIVISMHCGRWWLLAVARLPTQQRPPGRVQCTVNTVQCTGWLALSMVSTRHWNLLSRATKITLGDF